MFSFLLYIFWINIYKSDYIILHHNLSFIPDFLTSSFRLSKLFNVFVLYAFITWFIGYFFNTFGNDNNGADINFVALCPIEKLKCHSFLIKNISLYYLLPCLNSHYSQQFLIYSRFFQILKVEVGHWLLIVSYDHRTFRGVKRKYEE